MGSGVFPGQNQWRTQNCQHQRYQNLFRLYEQHAVPHTADGLPENVSFGDDGSNPYDHVSRLRDATFGDTAVREFDIARISQ